MAGRLAALLTKISPDIQQAIGNIDDIRVRNNFADAQSEIKDIEKRHGEAKKFIGYNVALQNTNLSPEDYYKSDKGFELNPGYEGSKAYLDYKNALDGKNPDPTEFKTFVQAKPEYYEELYKNGQLKQNTVPLTSQELKAKMYEKAGIKPEEMGWFDEMQKTFDPEKYNRQLNNLVVTKYPELTSTQGSLGDTFAKLFGKEVEGYGITVPKYEDPLAKTKPSEWELQEKDGKYYWTADVYNPQQGWTKKVTRVETDKKVIDEWDRKHSAKPKGIADYTADEINKMSFEDLLKNFNAEAELKPHFDSFSPEIQQKLYDMFPKWKEEDLTADALTNKRLSTGRSRSGRKIAFDLPNVKQGLLFDNAYKYATDPNSEAGIKAKQELKKTGLNDKSIQKLQDLIGNTKDEDSAKKNFAKMWDEAGKYGDDSKTPKISTKELKAQRTTIQKELDNAMKELSGVRDPNVLNSALNDFIKWMEENEFDDSLIDETVKNIENEVKKRI